MIDLERVVYWIVLLVLVALISVIPEPVEPVEHECEVANEHLTTKGDRVFVVYCQGQP